MSRKSTNYAPSMSVAMQEASKSREPHILVGPVIGMVTDSTARVLVEVNKDTPVRLFLTDITAKQFVVEHNVEPGRPFVFNFNGLQPDTYYKVTANVPTPGLVKAGFRTVPANWNLRESPANIGFVSSNKYTYTRDCVDERYDLWKDLYKKASRHQIDYLCHVGDNVFVDPEPGSKELSSGQFSDFRWQQAYDLLRDIPETEWPAHHEDVCEIFRNAYRDTWNHPPTKHTLANVPNLSIMNDHDIRTKWGEQEWDNDQFSVQYFIGCCAYEVYNEYQRALFEDYEYGTTPGACTRVGQAYHFHVFGDVGFMFLDTRACKTFHKEEDEELDSQYPVLGYSQWKDIELALGDDGYFSGIRMLICVTPTPVAYVGDSETKALATLSETWGQDMKHWWSSKDNAVEARMLLSTLFDWRAKEPGWREICMVSGNVGQGGYTDILDTRYRNSGDDRNIRCKQICTSPVANAPGKLHETVATQLARAQVLGLGECHQFSHHSWTTSRNFAVLNIFHDEAAERGLTSSAGRMGVATKFRAQLFTTDGSKKKSLQQVESTTKIFAIGKNWNWCGAPSDAELPALSEIDFDKSIHGSSYNQSTLKSGYSGSYRPGNSVKSRPSTDRSVPV